MSENGAIYSKDKTKLIRLVDNSKTIFEIPYGVNEIEHNAFYQKWKLEQITIPETVITIRQEAFRDCKILNELEIPSSVQTIESGAFSECSNLKNVLIRKEKNSISGSPWGCVYGERAMKWQP